MENASKALIIAGAILISILLISVGVIINSTNNVNDEVGRTADTMAIETFNSQFTNYEGTSVSASQVKSLVSKIKASNATNEATSTSDEKYVDLDWTSLTGAGDLKNTKKYKVTLDYGVTGYVNKVTISEAKKSE